MKYDVILQIGGMHSPSYCRRALTPVRAVIDRSYSLAEVPEAVRHVEQGHARGKVLVRVCEAG